VFHWTWLRESDGFVWKFECDNRSRSDEEADILIEGE
jgi:hypothetical protein